MEIDPELMREGEWRLRGLLPKARALSLEHVKTDEPSGLAEAMRPYLNEANSHALVVRPGDRGGWVADLCLKDVPTGVSNIFGTSDRFPYEAKTEAIEAGIMLLAMALNFHREDAPHKPVFLLHDCQITLHQDVLDKADQLARVIFADLSDAKVRRDREEALLITLRAVGFEQSCSEQAFDAMTQEQRIQLMGALHSCAATGLLAFPFRRPAAPGEFELPTI